MNEPDFDQFGLLWRAEPSLEEARIFRRLAARAQRRGKLLYHLDMGMGAGLAGAGLLAVLLGGASWTGAIGGALLVLISWHAWRRVHLHKVERMVTRSDRETMLASAAKSLSARLRNSAIGLVLLGPSWLLGVGFKSMIELDGDAGAFVRTFGESLDQPRGLLALAGLLAVAIWFGRQHVMLRRELRAVEALQRAYREDTLLDLPFPSGHPEVSGIPGPV